MEKLLLKNTWFLAVMISLCFAPVYAQVGIGTSDPSPSTALHMESNNKGLLIPNVHLENLENLSPISANTAPESLVVFNTNDIIGKGFYYWNGLDRWIPLGRSGEMQLATHDQLLSEDRQIIFQETDLNFVNNAIVTLPVGHLFLSNGELVALRNTDFLPFASVYKSAPSLYGPQGGLLGIHYQNQKIALEWDSNGKIRLHQYPFNSGTNTFMYNMAVGEDGNIISAIIEYPEDQLHHDWYAAESLTGPHSINNNIYSFGQVGVGTGNPEVLMHLKGSEEESSANILIESTNQRGSIFFQNGNSGSQAAFMEYGHSAGESETLIPYFHLGIANASEGNNDVRFFSEKDINLHIGNNERLTIKDSAVTPYENHQFSLGGNENRWKNSFSQKTSLSNDLTVGGNWKYESSGTGNTAANYTYLLAVDETGKVIETRPYVPGLQFFSYKVQEEPDPSIFLSPPLGQLIFNDTIVNSGHYQGELDSAEAIDLMKPPGAEDGYVIKIVGYYYVKNEGEFFLTFKSDDGSRIYVDDALIVDYWRDSGGTTITGSVYLAPGKHKFEFWYYENDGNQKFKYYWGENPDGHVPGSGIQASVFTVD